MRCHPSLRSLCVLGLLPTLGWAGDPDGIIETLELVEHSREKAVALLGALTPASDAALLELLDSPDLETRNLVTCSLRAERLASLKSEKWLADMASRGPWRPRHAALRALAKCPPTASSLPLLLRLARTSDRRDLALQAIGAVGRAARTRATEVVEIVEGLPRGKQWPDYDRLAGIQTLGEIGGQECVGALEKLLDSSPSKSVLNAFVSADPANAKLRKSLRALLEPPKRTRWWRPSGWSKSAAFYLFLLDLEHRPAIANMARFTFVHEWDLPIGFASAQGIGRRIVDHGFDAIAVEQGLRPSVHGSNLGRLLTLLSPTERDAAADELVAVIEKARADSSWNRCIAAFWALGEFIPKNARAASEIARTMLSKSAPTVLRRGGATALGDLRMNSQEVTDALLDCLRASNRRVVWCSLRAARLLRLKDAAIESRVRFLVTEVTGDPNLKKAALETLGRIGAASMKNLLAIEPGLQNSETRKAAAAAVFGLGAAPSAKLVTAIVKGGADSQARFLGCAWPDAGAWIKEVPPVYGWRGEVCAHWLRDPRTSLPLIRVAAHGPKVWRDALKVAVAAFPHESRRQMVTTLEARGPLDALGRFSNAPEIAIPQLIRSLHAIDVPVFTKSPYPGRYQRSVRARRLRLLVHHAKPNEEHARLLIGRCITRNLAGGEGIDTEIGEIVRILDAEGNVTKETIASLKRFLTD